MTPRRTGGKTAPSERAEIQRSLPPALSPEDTLERFRLWKAGDESQREAIISGNLVMTFKLTTFCHTRADGPLCDLFAEATSGLIRAVDKFDVELGFAFWTFAAPHVRKAIQEARRVNRLCPIKPKLFGYRNASAEYAAKFAAYPTVVPWGDAPPVAGKLSREAEAFEAEDWREATRARLVAALGRLREDERAVVELRYGLGPTGESLPFREIGTRLGKSTQVVHSRGQYGIQKLRRILASERSVLCK